ncbi:MAG: FAD-dependent oxidoreductase, partial [Clostridium sp.]
MENKKFDVAVIGGGPAGLAAALAAEKQGEKVILIERENRLGGILKQCIHDGFGLIRFKKKMAGPEYALSFIEEVEKSSVKVELLTFVTKITKTDSGIKVTVVNNQGISSIEVKTLVLSTGCRERTARQVAIHGTRPAGVFTAGTAQYYTNILGQLPTKKCIILGSGDIGLIMARRLTLEGAKVLGVYEAKSSPSGLRRNISQCLYDFNIPLYTSHTVTRVFGQDRLTGVEISKVDGKMQPIKGTEEYVECDSLILSVGLIPENELAESLSIPLDSKTKGPIADQNYMTMEPGIFTCGNAMHVNDLVDYVSESGEVAGKAAAEYSKGRRIIAKVNCGENILYEVPQILDLENMKDKTVMFFRADKDMGSSELRVTV